MSTKLFFSNQLIMLALGLAVLSGCKGLTTVDKKETVVRESKLFAGTGEALIYETNPYVLAGETNFKSFDIEKSLTAGTITTNSYLEKKCSFTQKTSSTSNYVLSKTTEDPCFLVLNDSSTSTQALQAQNNSWNFEPYSDEFYQVNLFYHLNKIQTRFLETLNFIHTQVHINSKMTLPPATKYNLASTGSFWLTENGANSTLKAYSKCYTKDINASYSPSDNSLCFGYNEETAGAFRMVQDPSVIYHEFGHALVKLMMNQRNITSGTNPNTLSNYFNAVTFSSHLGQFSYSEADALNEGIADYFSYYINGREKVGEWGLGAFYGIANNSSTIQGYRPMNEDDSAHSADVSSISGKRLSYPQFLHYDNNYIEGNVEDPHNAGMIISHYLVSLTNELKKQCSFSTTNSTQIHNTATDYVVLLLNETLAEIGDLTAKGSDLFSQYATLDPNQDDVYFTNLNPDQSYLWTHTVNPPNYRRFFRIFGKNILHHVSTDLCPAFSLDESEKLLDDYGLLLFKSYEDRGSGLDSGSLSALNYFNYNSYSVIPTKNLSPVILNTEVNEDNRRNSVLVSKDLIKLDTDVTAFIFDSQNSIQNILANLTFKGQNVTTTEGLAGVEYNNNNVKISPGEVVGLAPNLFNNSNSTVAGLQILANDWDHMKLNTSAVTPYNYVHRALNSNALSATTITGNTATHSACTIQDFPKSSEGGVTDTTSTTAGSCSYFSRTNNTFDFSSSVGGVIYPKFDVDAPQPVCLVKYRDQNETRWVPQDYYRRNQLNLEDDECLNNASMSGNNFNPNECLIRILPGASQSLLGKIDAQKTWAQTIQTDSDQKVVFNSSGLMLMEVNKLIPPDTEFTCRFRTRFTNCLDCYNNKNVGDDYADYQYTGHAPFKIINFQFKVQY